MLACASARSAKTGHSRSSSTSVLSRDQRLSAWVSTRQDIVVAFGPVPVQEGVVGVGAILPALPGTTPVGVDEEAWDRRLDKKGSLQGRGDQFCRHRGPRVPALPGTTHDELGAPDLEGAQI